jgi:hypothetical protein
MDADLQAKVDFFTIPCPAVRRATAQHHADRRFDGRRGARDQATATGAFDKTYTIPPTGGPRIRSVIPIIIGGVPSP